ncbi:hypothetical protein [Aquimarina sp. MMG016]|uniref:hypothetical protein n=1 Tax=Aquimarina sp. MMG016 TaxID=2822690 RepID=UPI001B3A5B2B|nr:hypothetical protein [Aquimarina sp. MMG016]MBQ4822323.1 hypothetical protein [Aquimarina sp. MMG016]
MKKVFKIWLLAGWIVSQVLISCSGGIAPVFNKKFTSATVGSVNSYVAKPIYYGEDTSAVYGSINLDFANHEQFRQEQVDKKTMASFNVYQSFTKRNWNLFYGASGSYGKYTFKGEEFDVNNNPTIVRFNENYEFYNLGLSGGVNYRVSTSKFEFRPIGLKTIFNYEFGSYQEKLSAIENIDESDRLQNYEVFNQNPLFTALLESEIEYKFNKNNSISFGTFLGLNSVNFEDGRVLGAMSSYKYKQFVLSYLYESTLLDTQYNESKNIGSHNIGIAFQLF